MKSGTERQLLSNGNFSSRCFHSWQIASIPWVLFSIIFRRLNCKPNGAIAKRRAAEPNLGRPHSVTTRSRSILDTRMGNNTGHKHKLPPLTIPSVKAGKKPTLQIRVKLMRKEEKHLVLEPLCWWTKNTPVSQPPIQFGVRKIDRL